jgi:hypothetical protein
MMLCETCYAQVVSEKLLDTICIGCTDINRPLIDDMAGSGE